MVGLMLAVSALFYFILTRVLAVREAVTVEMMLLVSFAVILLVTAIVSKMVEKKLRALNKHLADCNTANGFFGETEFVTREFDQINQNLIKVLKKAKKREEDKQKYNAKLKLKNKQRSDMLSAIAHEFRNPISSIIGYSQTLYDDKEISRAIQEQFLTKIYNNGYKIEALLSRLILWNKFESGEAILHKSRFDAVVLAHEAIRSLNEKYPKRVIKIDGDKSMVTADRILMDVVLKNLIENALKYSQDEVKVAIAGGNISVADHGVGIAPEDIDKVTKKFYRTGAHSWDNSMGLGLAIVKAILELHGTQLAIKSVKGQGSEFSFHLN
jgi:signal transduction histidine kinase